MLHLMVLLLILFNDLDESLISSWIFIFDLINNNFRKVEDWANKIGVKTIDIEPKKFDPFFNINTKEDFEKAKEILNKN